MTLDHVSTPELGRVEALAREVRSLERHSPLTAARYELSHAIQAAHQVGHSYRAIAQAAGISHQRVAQLLQKEER